MNVSFPAAWLSGSALHFGARRSPEEPGFLPEALRRTPGHEIRLPDGIIPARETPDPEMSIPAMRRRINKLRKEIDRMKEERRPVRTPGLPHQQPHREEERPALRIPAVDYGDPSQFPNRPNPDNGHTEDPDTGFRIIEIGDEPDDGSMGDEPDHGRGFECFA